MLQHTTYCVTRRSDNLDPDWWIVHRLDQRVKIPTPILRVLHRSLEHFPRAVDQGAADARPRL